MAGGFSASQIQGLLSASGNQPTPIFSFRAGVCHQSMNATKCMVTADPRRGTVKLVPQEGLLHLRWCVRPAETVELDLMLFRDACTWERVNDCTDGRVYLLKFKDNGARHWFWLQDSDTTKDKELEETVNKILKGENMPTPKPGESLLRTIRAYEIDPPVQFHEAIAANNERQRAAFNTANAAHIATATALAASTVSSSTSTSAPTSASTATTTATSSLTPSAAPATSTPAVAPGADANALARALAAMAQQAAQAAEHNQPKYHLNDVLDAERVLAMLEPADIEQLVGELPEGDRDDIGSHLRSAQFHQTVTRLNGLLHGTNYGSLMSSLGLPADGFGVEGLITALQQRADRQRGTAQSTSTSTVPSTPNQPTQPHNKEPERK